jgi:ABC-type branched-subunit amino acid transport system ATPase component
VRDLHHAYGSFVALDGIDLEVATGEIFALLGPNGAARRRRSTSSRATGTGPPVTSPC